MARRVRLSKRKQQYKRQANANDFAKMVAAASAVVIQNRGNQYRSGNPEYVLFKFPYWVTFADDFPKGHRVAKDLETTTYKINAVKLLNWLHLHGHSLYDSKALVQQTRKFELLDNSIDKLIGMDEYVALLDSEL